MAYATQTQIQMAVGGADRFLSLTDWNADGVADADVIADAQAAAEAWMHDFLRDRFTVPVIPTTSSGGDSLAAISAAETVYVLRRRREMVSETDEKYHLEREAALKAFADGHRRPDDPMPAKSTAIVGRIVDNCDPISREGLKGSVW